MIGLSGRQDGGLGLGRRRDQRSLGAAGGQDGQGGGEQHEIAHGWGFGEQNDKFNTGFILDEREFNALADAALGRIEAALERCEADIDYETLPGGVLEVECADGSKIIVNRHSAAREIWLAARSGGYHFRPEAGAWRGTRDGEELMAALSRCLSEQTGEAVRLE